LRNFLPLSLAALAYDARAIGAMSLAGAGTFGQQVEQNKFIGCCTREQWNKSSLSAVLEGKARDNKSGMFL